jgi:hypothetical protein
MGNGGDPNATSSVLSILFSLFVLTCSSTRSTCTPLPFGSYKIHGRFAIISMFYLRQTPTNWDQKPRPFPS